MAEPRLPLHVSSCQPSPLETAEIVRLMSIGTLHEPTIEANEFHVTGSAVINGPALAEGEVMRDANQSYRQVFSEVRPRSLTYSIDT